MNIYTKYETATEKKKKRFYVSWFIRKTLLEISSTGFGYLKKKKLETVETEKLPVLSSESQQKNCILNTIRAAPKLRFDMSVQCFKIVKESKHMRENKNEFSFKNF